MVLGLGRSCRVAEYHRPSPACADARNQSYPGIRLGVKGEFTQELTSR